MLAGHSDRANWMRKTLWLSVRASVEIGSVLVNPGTLQQPHGRGKRSTSAPFDHRFRPTITFVHLGADARTPALAIAAAGRRRARGVGRRGGRVVGVGIGHGASGSWKGAWALTFVRPAGGVGSTAAFGRRFQAVLRRSRGGGEFPSPERPWGGSGGKGLRARSRKARDANSPQTRTSTVAGSQGGPLGFHWTCRARMG